MKKMLISENLKPYSKIINLFIISYLICAFIIPPFISGNTNNLKAYHLFNIIISSVISFYGIVFLKKNYFNQVLFFFLFIFLTFISLQISNFKSIIFFYYFFVAIFSSLVIIEIISFKKIIKLYCDLCLVLAIYGIYEYINPFETLEFGSQLESRLNSIFKEPSHFGLFVTPSIVYYYRSVEKSFIKVALILSSIIFTFSFSTYILISIMIIFYILYFLHNKSKFLFFSFLFFTIIIFFVILNVNLNNFSERYYISLLDLFDLNSINHNRNLTLWSIITSIKVNIHSIVPFPFGIGLGNFNFGYNNFLKDFLYEYNFFYGPSKNIYGQESIFWFSKTIGFNEHGHSLLFRIISELGIFGILFLILFIISPIFIIKKKEKFFFIYLIVFLLIFGKFLKISSYFIFGTPIFLALFFYLNLKTLMKNKLYKKIFYTCLIFLYSFTALFIVIKKINNEKKIDVKIYTNYQSSEYLMSLNNVIQNNFKNLEKVRTLKVDYKDRKAILKITYITDHAINLKKLENFIREEFKKFSQYRDQNNESSINFSEIAFYRNELFNTSTEFFEDLDMKFFIRNEFRDDNEKILTNKEIMKIKSKFKNIAGINNLDFIDNLNNQFPDDQPINNLQAKKYLLVENLLKSQVLFNKQNKNSSWILGVLINFYSNPKFRVSYSEKEIKPKLFRVFVENNETFNFKISTYFISISISLLFAFLYFKFYRRPKL